MADVYYGQIDLDWVDASTLVTFSSDTEYLIQNRGSGMLLACVADSEPTEDEGTIVPYLMQAHYKVGSGSLYLKSTDKKTYINISEAE